MAGEKNLSFRFAVWNWCEPRMAGAGFVEAGLREKRFPTDDYDLVVVSSQPVLIFRDVVFRRVALESCGVGYEGTDAGCGRIRRVLLFTVDAIAVIIPSHALIRPKSILMQIGAPTSSHNVSPSEAPQTPRL